MKAILIGLVFGLAFTPLARDTINHFYWWRFERWKKRLEREADIVRSRMSENDSGKRVR